jgi:hypothetical protein
MGVVWDVEPEQALGELADEYIRAIHAAVRQIVQRYVPEVEAWMKANKPWTDWTSNARQTLFAEMEEVVNTAVELFMSHGVDYGIFLELSHGGAYAIVGPALDYFAPKIWADVQALLS